MKLPRSFILFAAKGAQPSNQYTSFTHACTAKLIWNFNYMKGSQQ